MGSFLSTTTLTTSSVHRDKRRRRSNRLSKPPPKQATVGSADSPAFHQPSPASSSACLQPTAAWQNPWTGASIPISTYTYDSGSSGRRSHSLPSVTYHPGKQWPSVNATRKCQSIVKEPQGSILRSPTASTVGSSTMSRRASFQPSRQDTFRSANSRTDPQSPTDQQPKRSYSTHSTPHRTPSAIRRSTIEEAKSSNTHFMVDSQGFSLIRRRSLLTRPGVATRRSTRDSTRRQPPMIDQGSEPLNTYTNMHYPPRQGLSSDVRESTPRPAVPSAQLRPPTPNELEYTHLGALKLGSLRVVNGSASPCPSDRTRLKCPESPGPDIQSECASGMESIRFERQDNLHPLMEGSSFEQPCLAPSRIMNNLGHLPASESYTHLSGGELPTSQATPSNVVGGRPTTYSLQIPDSVGYPKHEDLPASPFSFERSPTIPDSLTLCTSATSPEGVSVPASIRADAFPPRGHMKEHRHRIPPYSHPVAESGYSFGTSIHFYHNHQAARFSQPRVPAQSRSESFSSTHGNGSKNVQHWRSTGSPDTTKQPRVHRQLSLQVRSSRRGPEVPDRSAFISSMCHETQQPRPYGRFRSTSFTVLQDSNGYMSSPQYCGQLRSLEASSSDSDCMSPSTQRAQTVTSQSPSSLPYRNRYSSFSDVGMSNVSIHDPLLGNRKGSVCHHGAESYLAVHLPAEIAPRNIHYESIRTCPSLSEDSSTSTSQNGATSDCGTQGGGSSSSSSTHSDSWRHKAANDTYHLLVAEEKLKLCDERVKTMASETARGRSRSRTIEHRGRRLTRHV
ncbi:uncharacterized protein BO97DRAFT_198193 [Aspergillus homomorphus CBS 101889]|uniref:Uncharacterized protein n=1 Tax=Aspergillus homomorphus (strain CBS 101889) TaxID=1450537 RepID=A0A395HN39_ASPHC|nr:hypothetical protein BO97DRAFT_198193 [Aspergillus homomorphus CBS 101889]RAL08685.1 hypothetical protein BO97DRAFT_198193 [Aspergillus homomorphus CBS 101889]